MEDYCKCWAGGASGSEDEALVSGKKFCGKLWLGQKKNNLNLKWPQLGHKNYLLGQYEKNTCIWVEVSSSWAEATDWA